MNTPRQLLSRGFTLIELLVVVAIISVLLAMLMSALGNAQRAAENVRCMSRLRQMAISTNIYAEENYGQVPDFFFHFGAGNSNNIVVLIVPKRAAVSGFDNYYDGITVCPSDTDPGPVRVLHNNGTMGIQMVSYGVNVDLVIRDVNSHALTQPSEIAFFFDGYMSGPGENPNHLQGVYKGSMELVEKMIAPRHNKLANTVFFDGHVDQLAKLTPEMIAQNGEPYVKKGGSSGGGGNNGGNGNNGGGNSGGGNGNGRN